MHEQNEEKSRDLLQYLYTSTDTHSSELHNIGIQKATHSRVNGKRMSEITKSNWRICVEAKIIKMVRRCDTGALPSE